VSGRESVYLPTWLLEPLRELAGLYQEYGSIPRAVVAIISGYIVSSVFGLGAYIVGSILTVFDVVAGSIAWVQYQAGAAFGFTGNSILRALRDVQLAFGDAIASAGPLAPVIAGGLAAIALYGTYRVGVAVAGEFPVASTIVDLLGLR